MNDIVVLALSGSGVLGGGETYVMRMLKWLREHQYQVVLMHKVNENFEQTVAKLFNDMNIERILIPSLKSNPDYPDFTKVKVHFPDASNVHIICFQSTLNFFAAEMIKHRIKNCKVNTFHYIISETDYCRNITHNTHNCFLQNIIKYIYCHIVKRMEKNDSIVYMTEEYAQFIHKNFGISFNSDDLSFARLGMAISPLEMNKVTLRYYHKPFTILTMTRFDFPTKGYVLGLVDEFAVILKKNPQARLVIIGAGADKKQLLDKINSQREDVRNAIELVGQVPYDQLKTYFDKSNVFLGIATGLLDSSNFGLLPISATVNQCNCQCSGFFYEHILDIGYGGQIPANELINQVMNMTEEDYRKETCRNYDAFQKTYDITVSMKQILRLENRNKKATLSLPLLYFLKFARMGIDYLLILKKIMQSAIHSQ